MTEEKKVRSASYTIQAVGNALGRVSVWGIVWFVFALLSFVGTLPWLTGFENAVGDAYERGSLIRGLDVNFRADHADVLSSLASGAAATGALLGIVAILLQVFFAGGWLQVFLERAQGSSLQRFALGGSRHFFRFLRLAFLTIVGLQLASWIAYGLPWELLVDGRLLGVEPGDYEALDSEWTAVQVEWARAGLFGLLVALLFVWGDYTRTRMALRGSYSAVWAGVCTFFTLLRHPIRTLRPMVGLFLIEVIVLGVCSLLVGALSEGLSTESNRVDVLLIFLVTQLALVWSIVTRGARYHAALSVSREVLKPASRPDPVKQTLGGPGGPRYPIEDGEGDEFGVSL